MRFKRIINIFKDGNVSIFGLRGRGKDLLMSNVVVRRKKPYVSNVDYGGAFIDFNYEDISVGGNTYENFIKGDLKRYVWPYPDGTDIYISDAGVYFPSQYCGDLNKRYGQMAVFQALSRHVGKCNFHFNSQALNRVWDKIREQSDHYILCRRCFYLFGLVIQFVTIYDKYESAQEKQRPLKLPLPLFASKEMKLQREIQYAQFEAQHGRVTNGILLYRNKSKYDTRRFKALLEAGK